MRVRGIKTFTINVMYEARVRIPKAIRRGPTHVTAKVGKILVALVEHRRPRFERRVKRAVTPQKSYWPLMALAISLSFISFLYIYF